MITPTISIENHGIDRLLRDIEDMGGPKAGETLRNRTGLLARICADRTQPVTDEAGGAISANTESFSGTGVAAKKMGQAAVGRDINRVYASLAMACREIRQQAGPKASKAFYGMMQRGEFDRAEDFLRRLNISVSRLQVQPWDSGRRHQQMRTRTGRINRGVKPVVIDNVEPLKAYIKRHKDNVGHTKSGWTNAARQIPGVKGLTKIPQWIRKQRGPGSGIDGTRTENPFIQLNNNVPWISQVFGGRQHGKALQGFDRILIKDLMAQARHLRQKHARLLAAA